MTNDFAEYEQILETHNPGDIAFIKSILLSENIEHFIQGESVAPYLLNALPMRLMVNKDHVKKTKEILKDLKLTYSYSLSEDRKNG